MSSLPISEFLKTSLGFANQEKVMKKQQKLAIVAALLTTVSLSAQEGGPPPLPPPPGGMVGAGPFGHGGFRFGGRAKIVTGAPYSADISNQSVQTLADGNTITRSTNGHVARDSQSRTYSQETITGGPFAGNGPVTVTFISDPVAGYTYMLNSSTRTAIRRVLKTPPAGATPDGKVREGKRPFGPENSANVTTSDLGTQNIGGVSAQGKSVTRTIPAGTMGNAQPITFTSETWYSPDLQIPVLAKRDDPRMGRSTYALTNIQRAEPPATLFQVPSDYTVQDAGNAWGPRGRAGHARPSNGSVQ
jgi:hypothetical protein